MSDIPPCPKCDSEYVYENGLLFVCPDCNHEWSREEVASDEGRPDSGGVRDAHGNLLQSGDTVKLTRDLKVKGTSTTLKVGTKVKNIRVLEDASDGHDIACKVDGIGQMNLKSGFVKKA